MIGSVAPQYMDQPNPFSCAKDGDKRGINKGESEESGIATRDRDLNSSRFEYGDSRRLNRVDGADGGIQLEIVDEGWL